MKKIVLLLLFAAATAAAQTSPALIADTRVLPADSPLVAAAKRSLAARRALAGQTVWVIDDGMVRHRVLTGSSGSAPLPAVASAPAAGAAVPSTFSSNDGSAARQQAERQRAALKQEQRIVAEENDQPYGGDVSEDHVAKRMSQIPAEIEALRPAAPPPQQPPR